MNQTLNHRPHPDPGSAIFSNCFQTSGEPSHSNVYECTNKRYIFIDPLHETLSVLSCICKSFTEEEEEHSNRAASVRSGRITTSNDGIDDLDVCLILKKMLNLFVRTEEQIFEVNFTK